MHLLRHPHHSPNMYIMALVCRIVCTRRRTILPIHNGSIIIIMNTIVQININHIFIHSSAV